MKKLTMMALIVAAPVLAGGWLDSCCPDWCYDVSVGAEALYWKPCNQILRYGQFDQNDISVSELTSTDHKSLDLSPDYAWGFRLFGTLSDESGCNFTSLEWAYVSGTSSVTVKQGDSRLLILPMTNGADSIFARQRTRYNKVSLKVGHRFCGNDCTYLYGYAGGRWVQARVSQFDEASGSQNLPQLYKTRTEFSGGGIEFGVGTHADLWCGFGLAGRAGLLGLVGKREYNMQVTTVISAPRVTNRTARSDHAACIGGFEVRLGIDYTYQCGCWWIKGEVGYETNYYLDALLFPAQMQESGSSSFSTSSNFGIGGVYFGLTLGY